MVAVGGAMVAMGSATVDVGVSVWVGSGVFVGGTTVGISVAVAATVGTWVVLTMVAVGTTGAGCRRVQADSSIIKANGMDRNSFLD